MYKGIVKVYHEGPPKAVGRGNVPESSIPFNGLILDVDVTAKTPESLIKKINTIMSTIDGDEA